MKRKGDPLGGDEPNKRVRLDGISSDVIKDDALVIEQVELQGLQALPSELILAIFQCLANKADLQRVNRVCQQFHELIKKNYSLWYSRHWPEKDYNHLSMIVDTTFTTFNRERVIELDTGDVAVLLPNGQFSLLLVTTSEWRQFTGHADPDNFHIARPINTIISLHHNQLATCAEDGIRIWNRLTAELVQHLPPKHASDKPFRLLCTENNSLISASPDGSIFFHPSDQGPVRQFEYDGAVELGELKYIQFLRGEIVAECEHAIVSWNRYGRAPTTRIIISMLRQQLIDLAHTILADQKIMSSGLISDNDQQHFNNPVNQGLKFDWHFRYPGCQVEVTLNRTFCFIVDLFTGKPPVFFAVSYKRWASHDAQGKYYVLRQLTLGRYDILFDWHSQQRLFKNRLELTIAEPVKYCFVQTTGVAFFVLHDNRAVLWDINLNISRYFILHIPDVPPDLFDLYQYGSDDWEFKLLLTNELLGMHKLGITIIWDIHTGHIKQHFVLDYLCDPTYTQHMWQMRNHDLLIRRRDEGRLDEEGDWVNKQNHLCIYRFLPPPPAQLDDAVEVDSDIMSPTL